MVLKNSMAFSALALGCLAYSPPSQALGWQDALTQAELHASELSEKQHALAAARSESISAGELPDPQLVTGVDNLPVQGGEAWSTTRDFMTMQRIGVMQSVTNADKRVATHRLAEAAVERSSRELELERLNVDRETLLAWLKLYFIDQRKSLLDQLGVENGLLFAALEAKLAAAGRGGNRDDEIQFVRQSKVELGDRQDELERDRLSARSALLRWVGPAAASDPPTGPLPDYVSHSDHLRHQLDQHPDIAVLYAKEAEARAAVDVAKAGKKSDWGVEMDYEHRAPAFGDMVSVQFTFALPVFSATRQDPQIAARQQELEQTRAQRESMIRQHTEELENLLANEALYARQMGRIDQEWIPLKQGKVRITLLAYGAGQEELQNVVNARRDLLLVRLRRVELEEKRSVINATLRYLIQEVPHD